MLRHTLTLATLGLSATACHQHVPEAPLPRMTAEQLSDPTRPVLIGAPTIDTIVTIPPTPDRRVTLVGELSVRTALEEIAKEGNFSLAISPLVTDKRVRLSIVNTPASYALQAVLDAAGLTLQPTHALHPPFEPSIVFYRLPTNVNTLSIEAIMKQFGVSRELAQVIIDGRTP